MGLIQTAEQLRFSYLSIIKGAESMNIDLRWIPPVSGSTSCSDSDSESSGSEDDSDNPEEVEEEDDVTSSDAILTNQLPSYQSYSGGNSSIAKIISENDAEELPPPIPPRAESLRAPGNFSNNFCSHNHHWCFVVSQIMIDLFHLFQLNEPIQELKYPLRPKQKKILLKPILWLKTPLVANASESVGNRQKRSFQGWWKSLLCLIHQSLVDLSIMN